MGGGVFELITSFPEKDSLRSFFKNRLVLIFYVSPTGDLLKNEHQFRLYFSETRYEFKNNSEKSE